MPRDLFGDVTHPSISVGNRKWYTLPLSLASHSAIVLVLIALPILAPALMPSVFTEGIESPYIRILPPPPPPPARRDPADVKPAADPGLAPVNAPDRIAPETADNRAPFETSAPGVVDGMTHIDRVLAPPPAPQPPIRISGAVRAPQKIRAANPIYPPLARISRVQGIVIIEATIGVDGQVIDARILRSVLLLDQAAIDAVRQWQYTPTLLNGVPVPVIMTVTVTFTLK